MLAGLVNGQYTALFRKSRVRPEIEHKTLQRRDVNLNSARRFSMSLHYLSSVVCNLRPAKQCQFLMVCGPRNGLPT